MKILNRSFVINKSKVMIIAPVVIAVVIGVSAIAVASSQKPTTKTQETAQQSSSVPSSEPLEQKNTNDSTTIEPEQAPVAAATVADVVVEQETPTPPTDEQLTAAAQDAVVSEATRRGNYGTGSASAIGQWYCTERMMKDKGITPSGYMDFINANYSQADYDPNSEGIQQMFFDGAGSCNYMVRTLPNN